MISVCMATFNGGKYIKAQIDSILCQLDFDDELIISDDGSTDNTIEIILSYKDPRIQLHNHEKVICSKSKSWEFKIITKNFENALNYARGDFIFLSDQDDVWDVEKISELVKYMQENNCELAMCNFSIIDERGEIVLGNYYHASPISAWRFRNIIRSKYLGCCIAFNRKLLDRALPFPSRLIAHDYWIGCLSKKTIFIDKVLHYYRRYDGNVSTSTSKSKNCLFYKIYYRFVFSFQIFCRLIKYHE